MLAAPGNDKIGLVVFDAGTNDFPTTKTAMMNLITSVFNTVGDFRDLILLTYNYPGQANLDDINQAIHDFARTKKRVYLAEWHKVSQKEPGLLSTVDYIHATPKGYQRRAALLAEKVKQSKT